MGRGWEWGWGVVVERLIVDGKALEKENTAITFS